MDNHNILRYRKYKRRYQELKAKRVNQSGGFDWTNLDPLTLDRKLVLWTNDAIKKMVEGTALEEPIGLIIDIVQKIRDSADQHLEVVEVVETEGKREIKINPDSDLIRISILLAKALMPWTIGYSNEEMISLFTGEHLMMTMMSMVAGMLPYICTMEKKWKEFQDSPLYKFMQYDPHILAAKGAWKYDPGIFAMKKLYEKGEERAMAGGSQSSQKGGIAPLVAAIIIVAIVLVAIVIIVVVICIVVIVVAVVAAIVALIALIVLCIIVISLIYSLPSLIAIYKSNEDNATKIAINYNENIPKEGFGATNQLSAQLPAMANAIADTGIAGTQASAQTAEAGTSAITGIATSSIGLGGGGEDQSLQSAGIESFCDIVELMKKYKVDFSQYSGEEMLAFFARLKPEDLTGPMQIMRIPLILCFVFVYSRKHFIEPLKTGRFNPGGITEAFALFRMPESEWRPIIEKDIGALKEESQGKEKTTDELVTGFKADYAVTEKDIKDKKLDGREELPMLNKLITPTELMTAPLGAIQMTEPKPVEEKLTKEEAELLKKYRLNKAVETGQLSPEQAQAEKEKDEALKVIKAQKEQLRLAEMALKQKGGHRRRRY